MSPLRFSPELKQHVLESHEGYATGDAEVVRGIVTVATRLEESVRSAGLLEGHTVVCDEPPARGGTGAAPAPLSYFLASLGF